MASYSSDQQVVHATGDGQLVQETKELELQEYKLKVQQVLL